MSISIPNLVNNKGLRKDNITPIGFVARLLRDLFAPTYEIIVYGGAGAIPVILNDKIKSFISEIVYEDNADQFDKLTIMFESQSDDFGAGDINSIIDSRLFAEGHILEIKMGYGSVLRTVGATIIVSLEPDFPREGSPTMLLTGFDLLHRASRRIPKEGASYKGFRDSQIASIIGSKNGFDIKLTDPRSFSGIQRVPGINNRIQKKGMSDYKFLKKVADINGFDLFCKFDPNRKKFGLFFQKPLTKKFNGLETFAYNQGSIPFESKLLNFKPKMDAHDQGTEFEVFLIKNKTFSSSKVDFIDRLTLEENKKFSSKKGRRFTGGNIGVDGGKKPPSDDGIEVAFKAFGRSFRFPKHKRFKNEAHARKSIEEFIKRQKENFITGDGSVVGKEYLQSRQLHNLEGISTQLSGKYYFTKVVHTMSRGEQYRVDFTARKVIDDTIVQAPPALNLTNNDKRFKKLKEG